METRRSQITCCWLVIRAGSECRNYSLCPEQLSTKIVLRRKEDSGINQIRPYQGSWIWL